MNAKSVIQELQDLLADDDPNLQEALVDALRHPSKQVRIFAALNLAEQFQDVRAIRGLVEGLESTSVGTQRAAAQGLWEIGDADTPGLFDVLTTSPVDQRDAVLNALYWIGWIPDDTGSAVTFYIGTQQWKACITMGAEAVPGLISALDDWDGVIRRGAAWALGEIGDPRSVGKLIDLLTDTEGGMFGVGDRVCDIAAEALAKINTPEAWNVLDQWNRD